MSAAPVKKSRPPVAEKKSRGTFVRLTNVHRLQLRRAAAFLDLSMNDIVSRAITEYLKGLEKSSSEIANFLNAK